MEGLVHLREWLGALYELVSLSLYEEPSEVEALVIPGKQMRK